MTGRLIHEKYLIDFSLNPVINLMSQNNAGVQVEKKQKKQQHIFMKACSVHWQNFPRDHQSILYYTVFYCIV